MPHTTDYMNICCCSCKTCHTFEIDLSNYISDMVNDICEEKKAVVNNTRVDKSL